MNFGGVLFVLGTYSTTTGDPFTGVTPTSTLDVSGVEHNLTHKILSIIFIVN